MKTKLGIVLKFKDFDVISVVHYIPAFSTSSRANDHIG